MPVPNCNWDVWQIGSLSLYFINSFKWAYHEIGVYSIIQFTKWIDSKVKDAHFLARGINITKSWICSNNFVSVHVCFPRSCFYLTTLNTASCVRCASKTMTTTAFSSTGASAKATTASSSSSSSLWWWPTFSLLARRQVTCTTRCPQAPTVCRCGSRC